MAASKAVLLAIISLLAFDLYGCADCKGVTKEYKECAAKTDFVSLCESCEKEYNAMADTCECKCEDTDFSTENCEQGDNKVTDTMGEGMLKEAKLCDGASDGASPAGDDMCE
jgi:hypothetical protein